MSNARTIADLAAVTATATELNALDGITSDVTELNLLDGVTATTAEINYVDGVTSNVQTQIDSKVGSTHTGDVDITGELLVDSYNETFKKVSSVVTTVVDLSIASYDSKNLAMGSEAVPNGIAFKDDGTVLYTVGSGSDLVRSWNLSTAWDVSTASASTTFSVNSQDSNPTDVIFKSDGTKMYVIGSASDSVHQYSLSTAWDLSTASYDSVSFSVNSQATTPEGIDFKTDGTVMFVVNLTDDTIYQYDLSTAWDVSTASYASKSFAVTSQEANPTAISFTPDGLTMLVVGYGSDTVYQYTLSTAWDVSTASYASKSFSIASEETSPYGMRLGSSNSKLYVVGSVNDVVSQYSVGVSSYNTTFDCENANVFETVLDGNTTVAFSNPPAAGTATDSTAYAMSLKVVQDSGASGYTVTWPTSVDWPSATAPTLTATASAVDQFVFYTYDGGTTWYGFTAGQALG